MITKERLKQLIKNWGTIFTTQELNIEKIDLVSEKDINCKTKSCFQIDCDGNLIRVDNENKKYHLWRKEYLFETKEDAEWSKMCACITIHFQPLMWKDIQFYVDAIQKSQEQVEVVCVQQFCNGQGMFSISLVSSEGELSIEVTNDCEDEIFKSFDLSEDGYKHAVEFARELFLGEYNE